jgi:hypothetical protein
MARCANRHSGQVESLMFVGSTPTLVTAEWTGVGFQHGLISRPTPVRIRPPQLHRLVVEREDAPLIRGRAVVRTHPGRLSASWGRMCQGWRVCLAHRLGGFDSHRLHCRIRKVAGYGWPGHGANVVSPSRGMRVRLPHLPLNALVVKRTSCLASNEAFRVRLLAGVLREGKRKDEKWGDARLGSLFFPFLFCHLSLA